MPSGVWVNDTESHRAGPTACPENQTIQSALDAVSHRNSSRTSTLFPLQHGSHEAVCVEVRRLVRLPYVLLNFRMHLPHSWKVTLMHGPRNGFDILNSPLPTLRHHLHTGAIRVVPLPRSRWISIHRDGHDRAWYNNFIISKEFWSAVSTARHVMLFEADSILCAMPTVPVNWWLGRFTYVGAPWSRRWGAGGYWCGSLPCCVGNSGLSLWDRELMAHLYEHGELHPYGRFVDNWASFSLQALHAKGKLPLPAVPNPELAGAFAWEIPPDVSLRLGLLRSPAVTPLGFHGVRHWGPMHSWCKSASVAQRPRCEAMIASCPAILQVSVNASLDGELS